jgi:integrase/recombinase XerD
MSKSTKHKFLSQAEFQTLLSYVKNKADLAREKGTTRAIVDELVVLLLARVGLRANEIRALKIEDAPTDPYERALRVRNAMDEVLRMVELSEGVAQYLTKFVKLYRKGAKKKDPLLETERGNPFGYMSLYSKVRRIGAQAGLGHLTPAILQHTYMVRLYETEPDLRYVQEQTGYVSRRTLAEYLIKDRKKKINSKQGRAESTGQEPAEQTRRHLERRPCEACGVKCATSCGRVIESGQFLCPACLEYFRADE